MKERSPKTAALGALKGVVYMRIQELTTPAALVRSGLSFVLSFLLLMLLRLDPSEAAGRFQALVAGIFALKFLPVFCLTKGGETLRNELKDGTIEYLWVRPARKVELYLGFVMASLLGSLSIIGPALLGIGIAGLMLGVLDAGGLLVLGLTVLAVVMAFTSISAAIGSLSSKFVVLGIFYFSFVELGLGVIPNGVQSLAVSFHAKTLLTGLVDSGGTLSIEPFAWILSIGAVGLALGATIFSHSRYVAGSEKEA